MHVHERLRCLQHGPQLLPPRERWRVSGEVAEAAEMLPVRGGGLRIQKVTSEKQLHINKHAHNERAGLQAALQAATPHERENEARRLFVKAVSK